MNTRTGPKVAFCSLSLLACAGACTELRSRAASLSRIASHMRLAHLDTSTRGAGADAYSPRLCQRTTHRAKIQTYSKFKIPRISKSLHTHERSFTIQCQTNRHCTYFKLGRFSISITHTMNTFVTVQLLQTPHIGIAYVHNTTFGTRTRGNLVFIKNTNLYLTTLQLV